MKKELLPLNLQFFAEEAESVNESEAAEPTREEAAPETGVNEAEPAEQQTPEQNAAYAAMRRKAEADAQRKYQSEQQRLDAMYAKRFEGLTNPETGQPIRTPAEYLEALDAQDRLQAKEEMQQAGIDPSVIDRAIANSPIVREAQAAMDQLNQIQSQRMIEEDIRTVIQFDPSVNNEQDILSQENFGEVMDYVTSHPGMRFAEAYKLVNFDRLASQRATAAKQQTINQAKSKGHLSAPAGLSNDDNSVDIPPEKLEMWRDFFPDKSPKELREMYNKSIGG
jgi:hypothetical protein